MALGGRRGSAQRLGPGCASLPLSSVCRRGSYRRGAAQVGGAGSGSLCAVLCPDVIAVRDQKEDVSAVPAVPDLRMFVQGPLRALVQLPR